MDNTLQDLIVEAQETQRVASQRKREANDMEMEANKANTAAKSAWNAVYKELLKLKDDNSTSSAFITSDLGKLLMSIK